MENIIEINHLSKSFGEVKAVSDLTLRVKKGELFAFLGVNGAGKSTTISIICGQLEKDGGEVFVCGENIEKNSREIKKKIGVVFQNSALDSALSVRDNLKSRAALYGITGKNFTKRLSELAELLDFENLLGRTVGKLSGGQRRRLDIARALIHRPQVLILDEVLSVGDARFRAKSEKRVMSMFENNVTVLFVSHSTEQVRRLCNKAIILDHGKMIASGTSQEVCDIYDRMVKGIK